MCQQQHHRLGKRLPGWAASPGGLAAAAALEALPASCCLGLPADQGAAMQQKPLADSQQDWAAAASRKPELVSSGSRGSSIPSTPSHACSLAMVTPPTGAPAHSSAGSTAATGAAAQEGTSQAAAAAAAAAATLGAWPQALLLQQVQAFQACVSMSPLIQSALLFLECDALHPPPACLPAEGGTADGEAEPAAGLECTLAQLLALHLRAGYQQATESSILACLWTMEALHSAWRSSATACLGSYVKLLAAFSPELVRKLTRDWPATFAKLKTGLVVAQADLLHRLEWRLMLSVHSELQPCHSALFSGQLSLASVCCAVRQRAAALGGTATALPESPGSCHSTATAEACAGATVVAPCGSSAVPAVVPSGSSTAMVPCGSCTCRERLTPDHRGVEVEQQPPAKRLRIAA
ncbi:hypothetical protein C2E21_5525 [Chlorella sorokiniana]|uniref:Uncharacterized protein n=1 Tax=Chlorella sorokiniana TaxID=3076 RepID=A0A2P6TNS4_CHLSO|nr:hypothetical protein C2E21_5525 [Chlorella sorokiniana]|eukprot:PRW50974.1 hypothetical protein C2E21_5525 [Chlorella sorokiniana]